MVLFTNGFQSTLPVRGATPLPMSVATPGRTFQSTLPVRGATGWRAGGPPGPDFNPRSP